MMQSERRDSFFGNRNQEQHIEKKQPKKLPMNYQLMEAKVQKQLAGESKAQIPIIFEAANSHHKYRTNEVAIRSVYSQYKRGSLHINSELMQREQTMQTLNNF